MTHSFHYLYLCSLFLSISAANDWIKPCFSGVCEYDIPSTNGSSGTLTIWGPSSAIGDITPAAGWAILDCSPESLQQTVRIACMDEGSPDCAHLFGNTTNLNHAVGKVVRLPETCGRSAFGYVTNATLHEDQTIPVNMLSSLTRRDGTLPPVHGLHVSTDTADWISVGQSVHFAIRASNNHIPLRETSIQGRGLGDLVDDLVDEVDSANDFDKDGSVSVKPIDINQNFTIIDQTISCPNFNGGVSIHVDGKSCAVMTFSIAVSGTFVPPKVDSISLTSSVSANIDAIVDVKSNLTGTLETGGIPLYEAELPGFNIDGILSIGPSFALTASGTATLGSQVGMKIGIKYNLDQPSFTFPHQLQPGGASVKLGDTPLKIDSTSSVNATGTQAVSVHLTPSFIFAINALGKGVNVFVNVDSSVSASFAATPNEQSKQLLQDEPPHAARQIDSANGPSVVARDDQPPDGCLEVDTRLSVNAGADADFFGLFNANTQIQLYAQSYQLVKQCFGSSSPRRSLPSRREEDLHWKQSFNMQCFPLPLQSPLTIVDSIIPPSSILLI